MILFDVYTFGVDIPDDCIFVGDGPTNGEDLW
jgi:hypothetical protein